MIVAYCTGTPGMRFFGLLVYGASFSSGHRRQPLKVSPASAIDAPDELHEPPTGQRRHGDQTRRGRTTRTPVRKLAHFRRVGQVFQASPVFALNRMVFHRFQLVHSYR